MKKRNFKILIWFAFATLILAQISCRKNGEVDTSKIDLTLDVARFELDLREASHTFEAQPNTPPNQIYQDHLDPHRDLIATMIFGVPDTLDAYEVLPDSMIMDQFEGYLRDSFVRDLLDTVYARFPEGYDFEGLLLDPVKRYHHYFPEDPVPMVRTFITDYPPGQIMPEAMDNVYLDGKYIGIGLHYYLGPNFKYYSGGLPEFIRRRLTPEHIPVAVYKGYANRLISLRKKKQFEAGTLPRKQPQLLDMMVEEGIKLYFLDKILPDTPDSLKIYYSAEQMYWAEVYEGKIYKELMPSLYSGDPKILRLYTDESPFTSTLAEESAPRLAHFSGWMIVRSYMDRNPDVTLQQLIYEKSYEEIFKQSKYRPEYKE